MPQHATVPVERVIQQSGEAVLALLTYRTAQAGKAAALCGAVAVAAQEEALVRREAQVALQVRGGQAGVAQVELLG